MKKFGISWMALFLLAIPALQAGNAPVLRFSGVLGQSQPINQKPMESMGVTGVVVDAQGNLWVSRGRKINQYKKDGAFWLPGDSIDLPDQGRPGGLFWSSESLLQWCNDNKVYGIHSATKKVEILATVPGQDVRSVWVAPKDYSKGFAAKNKALVLRGNQVLGVNGDACSVVLNLPPPPAGKNSWFYCAMGIEPNSGDLLVGSYYPDCKVYRYDAAGAEVRKEQWPRAGFVSQIASLNGQAWGVAGARLIPFPDKAPEDLAKGTLGPYPWINCSGLAAAPNGHFWIACSQGILEIDPQNPSVFARLGGLEGVNHLAVGRGGALLGTMEGGSRIVQLGIDDAPNTPLVSNANEPFRIGGNWKSKARGIVWAGDKYVVLDEIGKQLWEYHPDRASQPGLQVWSPLTEAGSFTNPKALAILGDSLLVMDGNLLKESPVFAPSDFHGIALPEMPEPVEWMAATPRGLLVLANAKEIRLYRRAEDGSFALGGKLSNVSISGLAVSGETIFLSDNLTASVVAYDAATGDTVGSADAKEQGGMRPGALTVSAPWLFVADENGKRILRFRILKK